MNSAQKETKALKNFKSVQTITDIEAQVAESAGLYFLKVMNNGREIRYVPLNLSDDMKVADSWVSVSGDVGQLPADSKALGFPLKISEIKTIEMKKNVSSTNTQSKKASETTEKRTLKAKETIKFAGSDLTVNRAVTHELGVLVSRGGDGETWLIEQYKNGQVYSRFVPINLADEFKKDGIQLEFDGHIGTPPPNVRLMGSPIWIEYMAIYEGADLKATKKMEGAKDKGDSKFK